MSETWTEYAVRWDDDPPERQIEKCSTREAAEMVQRLHPWPSTVVGRTVTASDWLPVDTDGGRPA